MDKKIIWEYYNPKECLQELFNQQNDDDEEDWKGGEKQSVMPFIDNPFSPKDYWIGHTNFRLNQNHFNTLNHIIDGVEAFKFLSNYRLVICVGQAFEWSQVRLDIEKILCNRHISYTDNELVNKNIQNFKTNLSKYQYWMMYVLPNGKIYSIQSNTYDEVFKNNIANIHLLSKDINGILIESDTCKNKS